jgi:hypothetical protein
MLLGTKILGAPIRERMIYEKTISETSIREPLCETSGR